MTRGEFEQRYADWSGLPVEQMYAMGQHAEPCRCDDAMCEGWQMLGPDWTVDPESGLAVLRDSPAPG